MRPWHRLTARAVLRPAASTAVLTALYYELPLDSDFTGVTILWLSGGMLTVALLLAWQSRAIARSEHPQIRAVEALATSLPLFLLLFATTYHVMETRQPGNFNTHLTRTDAVYFSVTVFATTGFGDITARSQPARIVTTFQMLSDLALVGFGLRAIAAAVQVGAARQTGGGDEPKQGR